MRPDTITALSHFPDVASVAALVLVIDLVDAAVRAAHPGLRIEPHQPTSRRRALTLLRSLHRFRRDAVRYVEYHADLVGPVPPRDNCRQPHIF